MRGSPSLGDLPKMFGAYYYEIKEHTGRLFAVVYKGISFLWTTVIEYVHDLCFAIRALRLSFFFLIASCLVLVWSRSRILETLLRGRSTRNSSRKAAFSYWDSSSLTELVVASRGDTINSPLHVPGLSVSCCIAYLLATTIRVHQICTGG